MMVTDMLVMVTNPRAYHSVILLTHVAIILNFLRGGLIRLVKFRKNVRDITCRQINPTFLIKNWVSM